MTTENLVASEPANATGRRKTAVARVNLRPGTGKFEINGREFDDYFTTIATRSQAIEPLIRTESVRKVDVKVKAHGGGISGQAGAVSMGIARALIKVQPDLRPPLKKGGFLTRDSRMKERKKSGQPGARKRFQFSKR